MDPVTPFSRSRMTFNCIPHITFHITHFAFHIPHFTLHISHFALLTPHLTLHTSHYPSVLYSLFSARQ